MIRNTKVRKSVLSIKKKKWNFIKNLKKKRNKMNVLS